MQKVVGVEAVRVGLDEGITVLDLKQANTVTLAALRKVLKDGGFVSKDARLSARGTVVERGSQLVFTVAGTGEAFAIDGNATERSVVDDLRRRRSATIDVTGTAHPATAGVQRLTVESIR